MLSSQLVWSQASGGGGGGGGGAVNPLLPSQPARSVKNVRATIAVQLIDFMFFPPYEDVSGTCRLNHGDLGLLRRDLP